jgi:hypothetical protein
MAFSPKAQAQTEIVAAGCFVIDMGVTPQTVSNGLKPYGMVHDFYSSNIENFTLSNAFSRLQQSKVKQQRESIVELTSRRK